MLQRVKRVSGRITSKATVCVALMAMAGMAAVASAQTPTMDAITFPIDLASIVTAVVAAGVAVLLLIFAPKVAFKLIGQLVGWLSRLIGSGARG